MSEVQLVSLTPTCLEAYVEMDECPNPEFLLFEHIADWLAKKTERYPILGVNIYYSEHGRIYALITLGSPLPLVEVEHGELR